MSVGSLPRAKHVILPHRQRWHATDPQQAPTESRRHPEAKLPLRPGCRCGGRRGTRRRRTTGNGVDNPEVPAQVGVQNVSVGNLGEPALAPTRPPTVLERKTLCNVGIAHDTDIVTSDRLLAALRHGDNACPGDLLRLEALVNREAEEERET